jgi:hypothetical protein
MPNDADVIKTMQRSFPHLIIHHVAGIASIVLLASACNATPLKVHSPSDNQTAATTQPETRPTQSRYHSEAVGYSFEYPSTFTLDSSHDAVGVVELTRERSLTDGERASASLLIHAYQSPQASFHSAPWYAGLPVASIVPGATTFIANNLGDAKAHERIYVVPAGKWEFLLTETWELDNPASTSTPIDEQDYSTTFADFDAVLRTFTIPR